MKVLVTGGTGFIGKAVIKALLAYDELEIFAVYRDAKKVKEAKFPKSINLIQFDLNNSTLDDFYKLGRPDLLIHLAWDGLPNYESPIHVEQNLFMNCRFLSNMIHGGLTNLAVSGTCAEYGLASGELSELNVSNPISFYSIAKDCLRKFIEVMAKNQKFSFKWMRLFYTFGDGQFPTSLLPQLEKAVYNGDKIFNMSGGEQLRDYLPVEKLAEYLVKCSLQTKVNGIVNCCSGKPISIRKFVEDYIDMKGYDIKLNLGYYPYSNDEPMAFWGNNSRLKQALGGVL